MEYKICAYREAVCKRSENLSSLRSEIGNSIEFNDNLLLSCMRLKLINFVGKVTQLFSQGYEYVDFELDVSNQLDLATLVIMHGGFEPISNLAEHLQADYLKELKHSCTFVSTSETGALYLFSNPQPTWESVCNRLNTELKSYGGQLDIDENVIRVRPC